MWKIGLKGLSNLIYHLQLPRSGLFIFNVIERVKIYTKSIYKDEKTRYQIPVPFNPYYMACSRNGNEEDGKAKKQGSLQNG